MSISASVLFKNVVVRVLVVLLLFKNNSSARDVEFDISWSSLSLYCSSWDLTVSPFFIADLTNASYGVVTRAIKYKKLITRWEYLNVTWRISSYLFTYSLVVLGTGTGTCNKVLVAKKKIFFCCWLLRRCTAKKPKLLASYSARPSSSQSVTGSALQQINRYLEMDDDDDDCLAFWCRNRVNLNKLVYPAIRALSVPAEVQQ